MTEPNHREHELLVHISKKPTNGLMDEDADLDLHWVLVRGGYLKNLVCIPAGWKFELTEKAIDYLQTFD